MPSTISAEGIDLWRIGDRGVLDALRGIPSIISNDDLIGRIASYSGDKGGIILYIEYHVNTLAVITGRFGGPMFLTWKAVLKGPSWL